MSIIDILIQKLAPHDCVGCEREGALLCSGCASALLAAPSQCFKCGVPTVLYTTCSLCLEATSLSRVIAITEYGGTARSLIWKLKSSGAQAAATEIAFCMQQRLSQSVNWVDMPRFVVPAPTATSRVRQRGYDQAKLIARALSRRSRMTYLGCLVRTGQTHQVGASRAQRLQQLEGSFRVTHTALLRGAYVLLVDDVVTTGASLQVAAQALKDAGAARVEAVVFARASLTKS